MADPSKAVEILGTSGVRVLPLGNAIRFITHMDLTASDVDEALLRIKPVATELLGMA
jgi:threonine aldolase